MQIATLGAGEHDSKYESMVGGLVESRLGVVDDFLSDALVAGLRTNIRRLFAEGKMVPAGIGRITSFQNNLEIRGDQISWIEKDSQDPFEKEFMERVGDFIRFLNQTCYTGINDFEFHYALYQEGSFYKRHFDQFQIDHGRQYSLVNYINDDWQEDDGGKLILHMEGKEVSILPYGGRSVFFKSDEIEHEVQIASRSRMSITGWLKRT